jgi:hypothetical protein
MPHEWITDRLPTEADADGDLLVRVPPPPCPHQDGWQHYSLIVPGQPWWSHRVIERVEVETEPTPCLKSLTDDQLHVHFVAVQAETMRRLAARYIVEAKRPGGLRHDFS